MKELTHTQTEGELAIQPEATVLSAIKNFKRDQCDHNKIDALDVMEAVLNQARQIEAGDTEIIERHLYAQGITLSLLFSELITRVGEEQDKGRLVWAEVYTNLALKAQNQARVTFTALAELKKLTRNTVIQQQITAVTQQVNQQS